VTFDGPAGAGSAPPGRGAEPADDAPALPAPCLMLVTDRHAFPSYRAGVELLDAIHRLWPDDFAWREAPYEFVSDRPAIDLLAGGPECREAIESGKGLQDWIAGWQADEEAFREERREILLYPEEGA